MKKRIELLILFLLFILSGYISIKTDERSLFQLIYTCFLLLSAGAIFFGNLYYLFPALLKKQRLAFFIWNAGLLLLSYFISALLYASWMADIANIEVKASHLIHPTIIQDALPFLLTFLFLGLAYAFIRHLFLSRDFRLLKKITLYTTAGIGAVALVLFIRFRLDVGYKGDTTVRFIEEEYKRFEEISQLPQFRNKVVYVDLWFSSCSPCLQDFTYLPKVKAQLKNQDIEYLYLARETSHPNSRQRWKNAIKKFNLQGWHVYMNKQLSEQVWEMIFSQEGTPDATGTYPRYLLLDKSGKLVSYNAKGPAEEELLIQEIQALLR